jgi:hypothetical protein
MQLSYEKEEQGYIKRVAKGTGNQKNRVLIISISFTFLSLYNADVYY